MALLRTISILAILAAAAVMTSTAAAEDWPWHSSPDAGPCYVFPSGGTVVSPMPAVQRRQAAIGTVQGDGFSLNGPAPVGVSTSGYDEWIYYRVVAYSSDQYGNWTSYPGNWTASLNYYAGAGLYEYLGGRWVWVRDGAGVGVSAPASIINDLPRGRTYQIWGEIVWGPFGSYGQLGPLWTHIHDAAC